MRRMLFSLLLIAGTAHAQLSRTLEKIEVNVIEVDVVVLDAQGKPVHGLTEKDFELKVGGRKRPISNFYAVDRRSQDDAGTLSPAESKTPAAVSRRDYLLLLIDDLHLSQHEKTRALDGLRTFVRQHVRRGTAAMLVASGGDVRILDKFTEDPLRLVGAIDAYERQPAYLSEYERERRDLVQLIEHAKQEKQEEREAEERGRTVHERDTAELARQQLETFARHQQQAAERTISVVDQMVHTIQGLDGRRVVVYVSDGLPMQPGAEMFKSFPADELLSSGDLAVDRILQQMQPADAMSHNLDASYQRLAKQAALAGVQFFAIDAGGIHGFEQGLDAPSSASGLDSSLIRSNLLGPIHLLADETGGQAITDTNDMNLAFAKLDDHLSTYYSLGFRSEGSDREDDIAVTVKRRGLTARATKHVRQQSTREQIADRVRAALYARAEDNPLDVALELAPLTGSESGLKAVIRVPLAHLSILPAENGYATSYSVFVAMLDENMRETPVRMFVHRVNAAEGEESVQPLSLESLPPGSYTFSIAIVDSYSSEASYLQRDVVIPPRAQSN